MNSYLGRKDYYDYEKKIQEVKAEIEDYHQNQRLIITAEELEAAEKEIGQLTDSLQGFLLGSQLQRSINTEPFHEEEKMLVKSCSKSLKIDGKEKVMIRTSRGMSIPLKVRYYRRKIKRLRGKRHGGLYPGLVLLGIHDRCTPELASNVSMLSVLLASFKEAKQVLLERGVDLDIKTLTLISYRYAQRAKVAQQASSFSLDETLAGRRVVVSADGGRIRIRKNKRGPKTKKGRNYYHTSWREPRLFIIYVVAADGSMEQSFAPFVEGCLSGPDALFSLLEYYLRQLEIQQADQVLFVSDGAHWLWNRYPKLTKALGLKSGQVHELIDFYHAVEHLGAVAALRKGWSTKERKKWITKHRRLLLKGYADQVIDAVRKICRGRNSKKIRTQRNYFDRNRKRMLYAKIKEMKLPIGSGAVESTIRRVINLRLKGASIYWRKENAEAMLMLRSYYKAGRWNILKNMANCHLSLATT